MSRILFFLSFLLLSTFAHAERSLLVFGDSLSAAYGIPRDQGWPTLLADKLSKEGKAITVANASVSGETTAGGLARLDAALTQHHPALVILELGGNDGLRGLSVDQMRNNLTTMVKKSRAAGAKVLLIGMRLPPNYGPDYVSRFEATFAAVAKKEKTAFLPFLLEPIATDTTAFQADGLHPVAAAQPLLMEHVWKALKPLL
ncbi:MAG: arylesterase [Rhodocyclaceae bacterium]|nr:MAG: arylesterase [Rhodocyclaceae bacterium]